MLRSPIARVTSRLLLILCTAMPSAAFAGQQHAKARLCRYSGCKTVNVYKPHAGTAFAIATGPLGAYVAAEAKTGYYWGGSWWPPGKGFWGDWHADHHGSGPSLRSDPAEGESNDRRPVSGQSGTATLGILTVAPARSRTSVDLTMDPSSFLQLDLSAVDPEDFPITVSFTLVVGGTSSKVQLTATRRGKRPAVTSSTTGVFAGHATRVTQAGDELHVLQFASPFHHTVAGDFATLEVQLEGGACRRCPSSSEP